MKTRRGTEYMIINKPSRRVVCICANISVEKDNIKDTVRKLFYTYDKEAIIDGFISSATNYGNIKVKFSVVKDPVLPIGTIIYNSDSFLFSSYKDYIDNVLHINVNDIQTSSSC